MAVFVDLDFRYGVNRLLGRWLFQHSARFDLDISNDFLFFFFFILIAYQVLEVMAISHSF